MKPNDLARGDVKYKRINPALRLESRKVWNQSVWWPLPVIVLILVVFGWPAYLSWRKRESLWGVREELAQRLGVSKTGDRS